MNINYLKIPIATAVVYCINFPDLESRINDTDDDEILLKNAIDKG